MDDLFIIFLVMPFVFCMLGLLIWSLIWVYRDAENRGKSGALVALMVFLANWPVSLLIWLVFRPDIIPPAKIEKKGKTTKD